VLGELEELLSSASTLWGSKAMVEDGGAVSNGELCPGSKQLKHVAFPLVEL
jgi:hypothetical protein